MRKNHVQEKETLKKTIEENHQKTIVDLKDRLKSEQTRANELNLDLTKKTLEVNSIKETRKMEQEQKCMEEKLKEHEIWKKKYGSEPSPSQDSYVASGQEEGTPGSAEHTPLTGENSTSVGAWNGGIFGSSRNIRSGESDMISYRSRSDINRSRADIIVNRSRNSSPPPARKDGTDYYSPPATINQNRDLVIEDKLTDKEKIARDCLGNKTGIVSVHPESSIER
eukprot:UN32541